MSEDEATQQDVDRFMIYGAYGEVMHQFQMFEMTWWMLLARSIKPGTSLDQADAKVEKWDGTTFGNILRGIKSQSHWPEGLIDELESAVRARNYLARHFLREYFVHVPSDELTDQAGGQLAHVSARLARLEERLEGHLRSLGIGTIDDLDEETLAEIDKLRPAEWFH